MSYRIEKKYLLNPKKYEAFIGYISNLKAMKIFEKRKVFSTYYDNDFFSSYKSSEEGLVPRKKIRIRSYNSYSHDSNSNLELKISSEINRFKKVEKIKNNKQLENFLSKGIFDRTYGFCKPTVNVAYEREYFSFLNSRITLDKNISYWAKNNNFKKVFEPYLVVEFKSGIDNDIFFENNIMFNPISRFSKYCRAMNKLFFNIKNY